jgi:lysyl-tRNA synthetase class I
VPDLIPGQPLIYERANGVVYAKYRDPPYSQMYERWIIGGDPKAVSKATGNLFSYADWQEMMEMAKKYPTLKKQLQKVVTTYLMLKDEQ